MEEQITQNLSQVQTLINKSIEFLVAYGFQVLGAIVLALWWPVRHLLL